jgi:thioredoxin-like negative regulator of GroEL
MCCRGTDCQISTPQQHPPRTPRAPQDFYTGESLITRLTSKNWEQRMTHGFWFVKFYAPWCTHCITSSAAFKEVARELDGEIEFGAVNCVAEQDLQVRPMACPGKVPLTSG